MKVSLNTMPAASKTYVVDFPKLNGGLNIRELNYRLEVNQSPNMKNLWWQNGVLQCRDGQRYIGDGSTLGAGYACSELPFWGCAFFHIGSGLYYADLTNNEGVPVWSTDAELEFHAVISDVPENRGQFFRHDGCLFYKNRGGLYKISYDAETTGFTAVDMSRAENAYTPILVINADPENGSGTTYQPENRLSPRKEIHYNAKEGVTVYHLPVQEIDAVVRVTVDGTDKTEDTDYTVDKTAGTVTFTTAPSVSDPPTNNTVEIVYSKENEDAKQSVMDCCYAIVAGNGNNLCILLSGCKKQSNAVFWNSNDHYAMNPGYFPMSYYNLCGDTEEVVTGFGMQYDDLILFKEKSVGKLVFTVESVDERDSISFAYQSINAKIGCDLPWSIQLVNNNLVFCNTHRGVFLLSSSSAAYENNVVCISENVNGEGELGLLYDVRSAGVVVSADDNERYWLCANGHVYVWDYHVSVAEAPSWFYFAGIHGIAYFHDEANGLYHLDVRGRVTKFERSFTDYGEAIDKVYTFPTQYFGGYDRLKDVLYILVTVRSDTDTEVKLRYDTDYERRVDLTPIQSFSWRLTPRNLAHRCLASFRYGHVAKRVCMCRHVRHFSLTLGNKVAYEDLAIVSAQIFYRYQGKER